MPTSTGYPGKRWRGCSPPGRKAEAVLLVLENLDRADAETIAAIADLAEWSTSLHLLVVGTFRSDDSIGGGGDDTSRLVLGPLTYDAIAEIATLYAEAWTTSEIQSLASASEGVPAVAHRLAGEWAREAGLRRVDAAAAQAAAARLRLTATRDDLAHGVGELQRLLERRHDQLPARPADDTGHQLPPYRGLESFGATDADLYFGREHLVAELVASVATTPFVAVIGPSGSGKSSLAKAGLVPALASGVLPDSESWNVTTVAPGANPLAALRAVETAIASGAPCLVVVDPLEELWTACRDERERRGFADRLLELAGQRDVAVVACMRSDFLGRVAEHPGLAAAIGNGTLLVSEMTPDELRRAVEGPARRRGLDVEPALVDTAVREVAGRPGALPLLSTALLATWERRTGPVLTLAAYREAGGVASALAGLADGCYDALEPDARDARPTDSPAPRIRRERHRRPRPHAGRRPHDRTRDGGGPRRARATPTGHHRQRRRRDRARGAAAGVATATRVAGGGSRGPAGPACARAWNPGLGQCRPRRRPAVPWDPARGRARRRRRASRGDQPHSNTSSSARVAPIRTRSCGPHSGPRIGSGGSRWGWRCCSWWR